MTILTYIKYKNVLSRVLVVRAVDLKPRGRGVRGLLEPASWPCVGAQVKIWVPCRDWTACKRTHNQYETGCGFLPHPR